MLPPHSKMGALSRKYARDLSESPDKTSGTTGAEHVRSILLPRSSDSYALSCRSNIRASSLTAKLRPRMPRQHNVSLSNSKLKLRQWKIKNVRRYLIKSCHVSIGIPLYCCRIGGIWRATRWRFRIFRGQLSCYWSW